MRVGILTHYNVYNQGAQLQMYAMKHWLEDHGHIPVVLTYEKNFDFDEGEESKNSASIGAAGYYVKNYLIDKGPGLTVFNVRKVMALKKAFAGTETAPYDTEDIDAVIIGSDEVFSIDVGCNKMMYGHGIKVPAIAYAPAFGRTTEEILKEYDCYDIVKSGLEEMFELSARDIHTQEMIRSMTGREVPLVCDPVILYRGEDLKKKISPIKDRYMIIYSYDRNMVDEAEIEGVKRYASKHGLKTVSIGTYHSWCDQNIACDSEEWYSYFEDAECVLTDTFHGSIASIKNHCNVAVFIRESINVFKLESLLKTTGLEERRLKEITEDNLEKVLSSSIDYDAVEDRLDEMIDESEKYLIGALDRACVNSIGEKSTYACSGCSACALICKSGAISIRENECGFYEAFVDKEKCTDCGECRKVCSRFNDMTGTDIRKTPLYALQSRDSEIVLSSSSGGVAAELARHAIENDMSVIGVRYDYVSDRARHVIADKEYEISQFAGSKYIQSNPYDAFKLAVESSRIDKDKKYLVFGTPCQIDGFAGVTESLGIRDQFLLVEIFCHGVPSYLLWDEQCRVIREKLGADRFSNVQFRYKKNDWHSYCLKVEADGRTYYGSRENTFFWQVFFENILLNDSCFNCRMRKEISKADIRLGDYWGRRFQNRGDGVSAVFACTENGKKAVEALNLRRFEEGTAMEMLAAQNMEGYSQQKLHEDAMKILRSEKDIRKAVGTYRKGMSGKQKAKRVILSASSVIPDSTRAKLRKANSSRKL